MKARMFEVKINLGNEAMHTPADVSYALIGVVNKVRRLHDLGTEFDGDHGVIMDINGNSVGSWRVL